MMSPKETTWTDFRICDAMSLDVVPCGIHEWQSVEADVIAHFTHDSEPKMTWMWENRITPQFPCYGVMHTGWDMVYDTFTAIIPNSESLWLFLEDSLDMEPKYWAYSGTIVSMMTLLGELPGCDYYLVSKKLAWVVGENHSDVLFAYGDMADLLKKQTMYEGKRPSHPHS